MVGSLEIYFSIYPKSMLDTTSMQIDEFAGVKFFKEIIFHNSLNAKEFILNWNLKMMKNYGIMNNDEKK